MKCPLRLPVLSLLLPYWRARLLLGVLWCLAPKVFNERRSINSARSGEYKMDPFQNLTRSLPKILVIILIQVAIALVHIFRLGQIFQGQAYDLYYSYFSDLVLPFGAYFLLSLNEITFPVFGKWYLKAALIFGFTTFAEICQFFGIDVLGVTFDPFDILMYAIGVSIAALVDVQVFTKHLGFWAVPKAGKTISN